MILIDLFTKLVGALAALLGLAGYVLILGAAILWLRIHQVDLPPEVPVSLASREELLVIGAKAVAMWLVLIAALAGLAAWIVSGDPVERHFGRREALLALAMTLAIQLSLAIDQTWMLVFPFLAGSYLLWFSLWLWPSLGEVSAVLLPVAVGSVLAVLLATLDLGSDGATAVGTIGIFGALVLLTPHLQRGRLRQSANEAGRKHLELEQSEFTRHNLDSLVEALGRPGEEPRPGLGGRVGQIALAAAFLLLLGVVTVASQLDRDNNFHKVLLSLANGNCVQGTYLARGNEQIVIAQPDLAEGPDTHARLSAIPTKEVLEIQIYATPTEGENLDLDHACDETDDRLVEPPKDPPPDPE